MYDRILVPTDGSEGTSEAIDHAIRMATDQGATLHAIYVVENVAGGEATAATVLDALEAAGQEAIDDLIERAESAGVETVEGVVARGTPHQAILDYADEHDIGLVVMGTHGRTGVDRYLLGSVAERVVRLSDVPTLVVPLPDETGD
ncbi:universal stress protein [Haloplanus halobius]|uniref:universal stress protein n=1 Tax=Haloplanus halobius TaxID=2934938 RepID=UPI00200BB6B5|nr:universal stress protein [Haloplanus sp. XH21]